MIRDIDGKFNQWHELARLMHTQPRAKTEPAAEHGTPLVYAVHGGTEGTAYYVMEMLCYCSSTEISQCESMFNSST